MTGFLGPNGAGKSTSMRMMVGLTTPTEGTATIAGRRFADLPNPGREVGVMLDASAQHAGRTGREILTIAQQIMGVPASRVAEMLELVSLTGAEADRRVGNYSLGMRQRLGIAAALIGDPSVLILDEPANGLDPAGIRWMRDLLRDYADHGGTVLLSSHLLAEIEIIADDIVMIGQGRIVCQGSKADLLQAAGTVVRASDPVPCTGRWPRPASPPPSPTTARSAPTRTPRWSAERRTTAAWCSPSSAPPTVADSRRCSSSSPPTPNERGQRHDRHHHRPRPSAGRRTEIAHIPLSRVVRVELRKMFDTRSGFWLIASIAITGLIATIATIAFAPDQDLTYYNFAKAIGFPITVILPMVALLSITSEWSQRSGLTTFTYVPSRGRVVGAKTLSAVVVAVASMLFAFVVGAVGNVVGSTIAGTPTVWDLSVGHATDDRAGQPGLPVDRHHARDAAPQLGRRSGDVLRGRPAGAEPVQPAGRQPGLVPAPAALGGPQLRADVSVRGDAHRAQWAHVAATVMLWIVVPGIFGLRRVMRSEVK